MTDSRLVRVLRGVVGPEHPELGTVVRLSVEDAERLVASGDALPVFVAPGADVERAGCRACCGSCRCAIASPASSGQGVEATGQGGYPHGRQWKSGP
jgi:hypothetical protein